jgi:hypothetical protein
MQTDDLLIESYGQTEPLTTRLNSILRDYPRGPQIFRELLQNGIFILDLVSNTMQLMTRELPSFVSCLMNATLKQRV